MSCAQRLLELIGPDTGAPVATVDLGLIRQAIRAEQGIAPPAYDHY